MKLRADPLRGRPVGGLLDQDVTEAESSRRAQVTKRARSDSLRTRVSRWRSTNGRASSGSSSSAASVENSLPTTAAREITARTPGPRRSRRADSSAWIVGGIVISPRSASPSRELVERVCWTDEGCPRLAERARRALALRRPDRRARGGRPAGAKSDRARAVRARAGSCVQGVAARPARSLLEQLLAREAAEQHHGGLPRLLGQVLDRVEQRRLRPVDVLEDHDHRSVSRQCFEQASGRPEDLLAITGGPRVADRVLEALGERPCLVADRRATLHRARGRRAG